jgi:small subunit ribosomal protein S6
MDQRTKTYEGMFLLDSSIADFEAASQPARNILSRYGAEVLAIKPWDDRKLVYEIRRRKRGLYILTYFKLDASKVVEVEHDCQLDERILRVLILRRETLTEQELKAETPATSAAHRVSEVPQEAAPSADRPEAEPEPVPPEAQAIEDITEPESDGLPADRENKP